MTTAEPTRSADGGRRRPWSVLVCLALAWLGYEVFFAPREYRRITLANPALLRARLDALGASDPTLRLGVDRGPRIDFGRTMSVDRFVEMVAGMDVEWGRYRVSLAPADGVTHDETALVVDALRELGATDVVVNGGDTDGER